MDGSLANLSTSVYFYFEKSIEGGKLARRPDFENN